MWGDTMPIKGMFNQKAKNKVQDGWEKQTLRINALEVQIKSLLEFEKKIRASMYSNSSRETKEQGQVKTQSKDFQKKNMENSQKFNEINKKLEEMGQRVYQLENIIAEKGPLHSKPLPREEGRDEREFFYSQIEMRVQLLERNILLVNEVHAGLLKRMEELIEKSLLKQMDETEVSMKNEEPILQTLYIDKLYLEKYEQNHNFAQLGINKLSGVLNIGATYGKEAIPKEITEQVKEDMAKIKGMKEDMESVQPGKIQSEDSHLDESSSEGVPNHPKENIPYSDIVIEDDDSL